DADALSVGGPDGEADAAGSHVGAEEAVGPVVFTHVEEVYVQLGHGPRVGRGRRRASAVRLLRSCFVDRLGGVRRPGLVERHGWTFMGSWRNGPWRPVLAGERETSRESLR